MSTLKGDLIPYLINKQFVKPPQLEKKDNPYSTDSMEIGSYMSDVQKKGIKLILCILYNINNVSYCSM